ncbi:hypothetical protein [Mycobacterium sp. E2479]|uniref:hypothetical protein n=1 Tax=Mycobacterium sp. E2479 TaxID=1834134 RepID=UPI0007FDA561|nr:hypothetical protein [Mycobacterium sp. E2479]OBH53620.1 hypothetical protein A5686_08620 [Mycobacterium sp. E2479]
MVAENDGEHGRDVSIPTDSGGESIATQAVNVGLEVFSVVMSFLTCGALHIYSDLPGGEKVGRTSFIQAIVSIFRHHDDDMRTMDGTSPGSAEA